MKKPDSLRAWLTAWLPDISADQLQLYVENGRVASRRARNLSFEYRYQLKILLTDYAGSSNDLVLPLLGWIEQNEVSLLGRADTDEPFTFEAEILDERRVDIEVTLDLTEPVRVRARADGGGFDLDHVHHDSSDAFAGPASAQWAEVLTAADAIKFRQGYADIALATQSADPDAQPMSEAIPPAS